MYMNVTGVAVSINVIVPCALETEPVIVFPTANVPVTLESVNLSLNACVTV